MSTEEKKIKICIFQPVNQGKHNHQKINQKGTTSAVKYINIFLIVNLTKGNKKYLEANLNSEKIFHSYQDTCLKHGKSSAMFSYYY